MAIKALVDTGAEVNLVRRGLLPTDCFRISKTPVRFLAANLTTIPGGRQEVECILQATGVDLDTGRSTKVEFPMTCYDADMGMVDLIMSYEWMVEHQVDVSPRKTVLVC